MGQRILTSLPNLDRKRAPSTEEGSGEAIQPDEVIFPGDDGKESAQRPNRLRDSSVKPARTGKGASRADPTKDMTNDELIHAIKRIDDRERLYALFAGPLGMVIAVMVTVTNYDRNPAVGHKGHVDPKYIVLEGLVGVVLGGIVVLAALWRRRSFVGYTLFFLGVPLLPYGIVFCGLGGWMIWRTMRFQKALTARGVTVRGGRTRDTRQTTKSPPSSNARRKSRRSGAHAHAQEGTAREATDGEEPRAHRAPRFEALHPSEAHPSAPVSPRLSAPRTVIGPGLILSFAVHQQCRTKQPEDLLAPADERARGGFLPQGPQHLHLGDHAHDSGVDGQEQQARLVPAHVPAVHLRLEERRRPGHERFKCEHQPGGCGRSEPPDLTQKAKQFRSSRCHPEHRAHHGLHTRPTVPGTRQRVLERSCELGSRAVDERLEQDLLRREPVEDGLLPQS